MINNSTLMLKNQIDDKMKDLTFHAVVNKVFLNALPIDKSEMTRENTLALTTYSYKALQSAGGFSLLEKAMENTNDVNKYLFLSDIYEVCTEAADEVSTRIAMEELDLSGATVSTGDSNSNGDTTGTDDNDESGPMPENDDQEMKDTAKKDDTSIDDIKAPDDNKPVHVKPETIRQGKPFKDLIVDAKMTDEEFKKFTDKMDEKKLDLPEVSRLINDRVEIGMKAEKETYKMIDESDQRLRDAITNKSEEEGDALTEDQADDIKESALAVPLSNMQRNHISLISKLQSVAIESLMLSDNDNYDIADSKLLLAVTENFTFDNIFKHTEPTLEETLDMAIAYAKHKNQIANESICPAGAALMLGTAMATVVYTFLQTLHSMNLICVTPTMVKDCCDKPSPYDLGSTQRFHGNFNSSVKAALEKNNRKIAKATYAPDVESALDSLNRIRGKVYTARDNGYPVPDDLVNAIENSIGIALARKVKIESAYESAMGEVYGGANRKFELDSSHMNSVARAFKYRPVDCIEFKCKEGATMINVLGIKDGKNVYSTTVALESSVDVPTASYLKAVVKHSNIPELNYNGSQPTIVTNVDGKRVAI